MCIAFRCKGPGTLLCLFIHYIHLDGHYHSWEVGVPKRQESSAGQLSSSAHACESLCRVWRDPKHAPSPTWMHRSESLKVALDETVLYSSRCTEDLETKAEMTSTSSLVCLAILNCTWRDQRYKYAHSHSNMSYYGNQQIAANTSPSLRHGQMNEIMWITEENPIFCQPWVQHGSYKFCGLCKGKHKSGKRWLYYMNIPGSFLLCMTSARSL